MIMTQMTPKMTIVCDAINSQQPTTTITAFLPYITMMNAVGMTMTTMTRMIKLMSMLTLVASCFLVPTATAAKTVTVFIMAGDSNVEGRGSVPELHDLALPASNTVGNTVETDNSTQSQTNDYEHLVDKEGKWVVRDDVYVVYEQDRLDGLKSGPLSVKGFGHTPNTFGPDVEFGHVMGNILQEKVVIIKAGWERRTLAKDFRPPSATGGAEDGSDSVTGFQFLRIVSTVKQTLDNLGSILGDDYANAEVMIEGLVWWHGYDDIKQDTSVTEYERLLQCFLRDIREALEIPWLPILIAELGGQGMGANVTQQELDFRTMQRRVVNMPEFNTTTRIVETAKYCVQDDGGAVAITDDYTHYNGRAHTFIYIGNLMAIYMSELAHLDRTAKDGEQIEADYEQMENNLRIHVMLFFGLAMAGFVVFVTVMRGPITKASLKKAWKDTVVALQESEQDMMDEEGDDDFSAEGPATEMAEGHAEENLVV